MATTTTTTPTPSNAVQIIHTSPDSDDHSEASLALPLNVLRRREPLGASANKPADKDPVVKKDLVPILKNSKSCHTLSIPSSMSNEPSFEIIIQNEIGPLGIHVVPCDQDGRLVVQGIEPGGKKNINNQIEVYNNQNTFSSVK